MKFFRFFLIKLFFIFFAFGLNASKADCCDDFKNSETANLSNDMVLGVKLDSNYTDNWYLVTFKPSFSNEKISMLFNEEQTLTRNIDEKEIRSMVPSYNKDNFSVNDVAKLDKSLIQKVLSKIRIKVKELCVGSSLFCFYGELVVVDIKKVILDKDIVSKNLKDNKNYLFFKFDQKNESFLKRFFSKEHLYFMFQHSFFSSLLIFPLALASSFSNKKSFEFSNFLKKTSKYLFLSAFCGEILYNVTKITDNITYYLSSINNKLSSLYTGSIIPLTIDYLLNNKHKFDKEMIKIIEVDYLEKNTIDSYKKGHEQKLIAPLLDENNNEIKNDKNLFACLKTCQL